jgi:hypothetical protein
MLDESSRFWLRPPGRDGRMNQLTTAVTCPAANNNMRGDMPFGEPFG